MSHFTVLVISNRTDEVDRLLAPFQENNMGDCPKEYLKFTDEEDEFLKEYNENSLEHCVLHDGTVLPSYHNKISDLVKEKIKEVYPGKTIWDLNHAQKEELRNTLIKEKVMIPFKEIYLTFEEYVKDYHGCEKRDEETGRYGYWDNPNKKWDWYQIGGRWNGLLKTTEGKEVNVCKVKSLDRSIDQEAYNRAVRFWEVIVEDDKIREDENADEFFNYYKPEYYIKQYGTKENYAKSQASFGTYALLTKDGKWYETGSMGWWGADDATSESRASYQESFNRILSEADPEDYLTVVDCHI